MMKRRICTRFLGITLVLCLLFVAAPPVKAAPPTIDIASTAAMIGALDDLKQGDLGDYVALRLTADGIDVSDKNYATAFDGRDVTLDLNGHSLNFGAIDVGGTSTGVITVTNSNFLPGNAMTVNSYLIAEGGSVVGTSGDGVLNANTYVSASDATTEVTVDNVVADTYAVNADDGAQITVRGNISADSTVSGYPAIYGAAATGDGSTVAVNGSITVTGASSRGVYADSTSSGTTVTVGGLVTASGNNATAVKVENSTNATVSVTGDATGSSRGVEVGGAVGSGTGGSDNTVTVSGDVTGAVSGVAVTLGSGHSVTVDGDVTTTGDSVFGAPVYSVSVDSNASGSGVTVKGTVYAEGEQAYGVGIGGSNTNTVTVEGDVITDKDAGGNPTLGSPGIRATGGVVDVTGRVSATSTGVSASAATVTVGGSVSSSVTGSSSYSCVTASSNSIVIVDGVLISGDSSTVTGVYAASSTVTVNQDVVATSETASATGVEVSDSNVTVNGDIEATGSGTRGLCAYGTTGWTATAGSVTASGNSTNAGVTASGPGTATVKSILASKYITMSNSFIGTTLSPGDGVFKSGPPDYFEYVDVNTKVRVQAWDLEVEAGTGGSAVISGTVETSDVFPGGAQVDLQADSIPGYSFDEWTSSAGGSFANANSASTTFTMPAAGVTVTANFKVGYAVTVPEDIPGGSITPSKAFAGAGDTITLTITRDPGKQLKLGSLKYNDGSDHVLAVAGGSATFTMPATAVTVSAEFEDLAVKDAAELHNALQDLLNGDTIKLAGNITYTEPVEVDGITVTFDTNGYTLLIDVTGSGDPALYVTNNGVLNLVDTGSGDGALSVASDYRGLEVDEGGTATVSKATLNGSGCAVYVEDSAATVEGDVAAISISDDCCGVYVDNGTVAVGGNVTAEGDSVSFGVEADDGGQVTVDGDVEESSSGGCAVYAFRQSSIVVHGKVSGDVNYDYGACAEDEAVVTLDGSVTGKTPIMVAVDGTPEEFGPGEGTLIESGAAAGYFEYLAGDDVTAVYVKGWDLTAQAGAGGSITQGASGKCEAGSSVQLTATPSGGYTFAGWTSTHGGSFADSSNASTTFTMPAAATTVKAAFNAPPSDDHDQGNGGGTPGYKADVMSGGELPVEVDSGASSASVDIETVADEAVSTGGNEVVTIPTISGVNSYTASIPAAALSNPGAAGQITLDTAAGSLTIPGNMLAGEGLSGTAGITIGEGDKSSLPAQVQEALGNRPVIQLTLTVDGHQTHWDNPGAPVRVCVPYTPTAEELANPGSIVVWYIDGSGNLVTVPNGLYDPATGKVAFDATHFSDYAVGYNKVVFNDVAPDAWYANAVGFIAARKITGGTGNGNYSPEANLIRGDFLVLVMKAYGISPDANPTDTFADAGNTYYTGYLAAAKRLGIAAGVGDNMFEPERQISRQEMFTLLYKTLKIIARLPNGDSGNTVASFSDAGQVESWATEALTYLVKAGTVGGSGGNLFPADATTRAELAQVLYNLLSK